MADVKWIKLVADMFDNRKIKQIRKMPDGDAIIVIWLHILCLAGQVNDNGLVYFSKDIPYTEEMLATEFDRPINTVRLALQTFQQFGMIEIVNNILLVSNWEKYQSVDGLEKIQENNRKRQKKFRANQRLLLSNVTDNVTDNVTVTHPSYSISSSISSSKDKDTGDCKGEKKKQFEPPTIEEVAEYCKQRAKGVNHQKWWDFYQSKGWFVGKNKMKDWKAAVRTWEPDKTSKPVNQNKSAQTGENSSIDMDKISRMLHGGEL